jgi:hypothetical protein
MFARLLATFCLVLPFVSTIWAQSAPSTDSELVVYLRADAAQPTATVSHMKRELATIMRTAGYRIQWRNTADDSRDDAAQLAVLELNGACALPAGYAASDSPPAKGASLATTNVTDGQVLPFSAIHCGALTRVLAPALSKDAGAQRDFLYGRAMARVAAHELYHILTRTTEHAASGVARTCFSTDDLLTERFDFEATTLARLRHRTDGVATSAAFGEEASDR